MSPAGQPLDAPDPAVPGADAVVPLGRRERRKLETRRRLLATARRLIAEHGAENLRISEVSDGAGVGFGTVYSYFESKEALVESVVEAAVASAAEEIGSRALEAEDPAETAAIAYRAFVRYAHDAPEVARILVHLGGADELFENALLPYARTTLERGIAAGRFDIEDLELALTSVSAAALAAIRGVLDGRLAPGADIAGATMMLRAFGVEAEAAREIATRPLPAIDAVG